MLVTVGMSATSEDMISRGSKMQENDKKCRRELRGALPPVVYNYVRGCETAKQIWDTLKEKYHGNEKTIVDYWFSIVAMAFTLCLVYLLSSNLQVSNGFDELLRQIVIGTGSNEDPGFRSKLVFSAEISYLTKTAYV
ncbi:unnamed protein product [Lactuca saligna]|uniref:Uncharacterized protein n=1 Tax=Lactuca saligna TaxID=75948 RepID=A0AA35VMM6_LACSI|nr:unnamed protein product [Lactuca saligna]